MSLSPVFEKKHTPATPPSSSYSGCPPLFRRFFGCRHLPPRRKRLPVDILASCVPLCSMSSTVHWCPQPLCSPECPPLDPPNVSQPFFTVTFILCLLPLACNIDSVSAFPLALAFPTTLSWDVSHHPAMVAHRSSSNLVHVFPKIIVQLAAANVVSLHWAHASLSVLHSLAWSYWSCMTPPLPWGSRVPRRSHPVSASCAPSRPSDIFPREPTSSTSPESSHLLSQCSGAVCTKSCPSVCSATLPYDRRRFRVRVPRQLCVSLLALNAFFCSHPQTRRLSRSPQRF